jgi:DNA-binding transcriptional ArsR family regulator
MIDRRLIGLASNPLRLKALSLLNERPAGVSEVAEVLDASLDVVGRELELMRDLGLVEVVGEVLKSGAVEPRYKAAVRPLWQDEQWSALDIEERKRLVRWVIEMVNADAQKALETGAIVARMDAHASRSVSIVDEQGWHELSRIHDEALAAIFSVQAVSAERLAESGEQGFPAMSVMLSWEMPVEKAKDD